MKKIIVFFIVILVVIFTFLLKGENIFYIILSPLQNFLYKGGQEIHISDNTNNTLIQYAQLQVYKDENKVLREHLNFLEDSHDNFVMANVIGKGHELSSEWFLLDKGKHNGLKKGFAVIDENGMLIGTIAKVKDSVAYLQPIFDRHSLIAVDVLGKEDSIISGVIQGEYGLTLKMKYVPEDKHINIGDTIITSGLDENIRRGIIIGSIAQVDKNPNAIFQSAIIRPFFNSNFRIVSVLMPL